MIRKFSWVAIPLLAIATGITADTSTADANGIALQVGRFGFSTYGNGYRHGKGFGHSDPFRHGSRFGYGKGYGYGKGFGYGKPFGHRNTYGYRYGGYGAHRYGYGRVPSFGNKYHGYGSLYGRHYRPHLDWRGPSRVPHRNHYDFAPGHSDKHRGYADKHRGRSDKDRGRRH